MLIPFTIQVNTENLISYHVHHELPVLLLSLKIEQEMLDQYSELRLECRAALYETVANFQTRLNVHVHQPNSAGHNTGSNHHKHHLLQQQPSTSLESRKHSPSIGLNHRNRYNRRPNKSPPTTDHTYRLNLFNQLDYDQSAEHRQLFDLDDQFERYNHNEISALRNSKWHLKHSNYLYCIAALHLFVVLLW